MERVELPALYPSKTGETDMDYTNRLLTMARAHQTYRQCSIGYHEECSVRYNGEAAVCMCLCHAEGVTLYTAEGWVEDGEIVFGRAERGKNFWPPVEGEPEGMWAHWLLALSEEDAAERAVALQKKVLDVE